MTYLAMLFIDFGLLRSVYCKISYLLAVEHWSHTNLGIGFMANVFFIFSTFLRF